MVLSTTGATASIAALIPCLDGAMSSSYPFSSFVFVTVVRLAESIVAPNAPGNVGESVIENAP